MSDERFSLDASILFHAIDSNDRRRHARAMEVVDRAAVELDCTIALQAFCEFFAAVTRKGRMTIDDASAQIRDWQTLFTTAYPGQGSLLRAIDAVKRHNLSLWDATIWSVAKRLA